MLGLLDENLKRRGTNRFMKARRVGRQAQIMATSISTVLGGEGGWVSEFEVETTKQVKLMCGRRIAYLDKFT